MTLLARPRTRGAIAATAATLGLALLAATPATAAESDDLAEAIAHNGGTLTVDAGPDYAGYDVFVQSQLPKSEKDNGGVWHLEKASLDAEGDATVQNFAGPVNLYFFSPSAPHTGLELPDPQVTAAIYRGGAIEFDVDPAAGTSAVDGTVPTVSAPTLDALETSIVPLTVASLSPSSYYVGEAFDLTFSDLYWATGGDLDGQTTSTVIYSEPTTIGSAPIVGGSVTTTIGAEYTTDPHTVALMDSYGRILTSATLDGGAAAAPEVTPAPTPVAVAPVVNTGTKTGTKTGARLAETGVETGAAALVATLLVAAGAGGLVVARRRRATA
ncbi:LPXTG cell wall anchor domain-containing protein [Rathayibacter sp. VKM Ac-2803]|uniref:LPXTG cell wall anchor domain-containing protein n=1 Tax=Rathayibacter sp. VKM Ac-2803 TaxID=2609256 RepID=UPI001359157E|nr:LPXTG cell wall anchor domain-containing protein [Rathayibacter sp. VKM Ac-2803]MWV48829.1 LPXTG cell wall anchor domain-containing protein [Rathayibacter sp. VKM Ac-2803]